MHRICSRRRRQHSTAQHKSAKHYCPTCRQSDTPDTRTPLPTHSSDTTMYLQQNRPQRLPTAQHDAAEHSTAQNGTHKTQQNRTEIRNPRHPHSTFDAPATTMYLQRNRPQRLPTAQHDAAEHSTTDAAEHSTKQNGTAQNSKMELQAVRHRYPRHPHSTFDAQRTCHHSVPNSEHRPQRLPTAQHDTAEHTRTAAQNRMARTKRTEK
jgi:hypothetical protein